MLSLSVLRHIFEIFVNTSQHLQNFIRSQRATETYWWKHGETWLVCRSMFLQGKMLWTRLLFRIRQTGAKSMSELILLSFIFSCEAMPSDLHRRREPD